MAPLIMFKRNTIEKNYSISNKLDANQPNNYAVFTSKWSDRNSYDNFNVLNNRKPQKTYHAVVIPDYITLSYSCIVYTYYIEQMNKIVESINYSSDAYWGDPQRFKFRAKIDSFNTNTSLNQGEERLVRTEFNIKLYGYIIPDTINKSLSALNKFPDKTKFIFSLETSNTLENTETTPNNKTNNGGYRTNSNARFLDQTPLGAFQGINNIDIASVITSGSFTNPNLQLYRGDDTIISIDLRTLIPYTSSYALTASYALNAGITIDTGSFVTTSSFNSFTSSYNTGSFTGSFVGNGSGLTNIPTQSFNTGSFATTGSNIFLGNQIISGSLNINDSQIIEIKITSSIAGTNILLQQPTGSFTSINGRYTLYKGTSSRAGEFITVWNGISTSYYENSTSDIGDTSDVIFQPSIVSSQIQINTTTVSPGWYIKMLITYL
jgi:hypothetical protein